VGGTVPPLLSLLRTDGEDVALSARQVMNVTTRGMSGARSVRFVPWNGQTPAVRQHLGRSCQFDGIRPVVAVAHRAPSCTKSPAATLAPC